METGLTAFGIAFVTMLVAEAGDKTQLALLALAARHRMVPVLLGAIAGFTLLAALAVLVGDFIDRFVPDRFITLAGALLFIAYGLYTLIRSLGGEEEAEKERPSSSRSGFVASFVLIAVLEFGDKTQLAILALAARFASPWWVLAGSVLGFALLSLVAVLLGTFLRDRVGLARIERAGAVVFILIGVLLLLL